MSNDSSPLETFYLSLDEPLSSTLLYVRRHLLKDELMTEAYKWRLPCFLYKGKMFAYLWTDKKSKMPYIGFMDGNLVEHPALESGDRKRIKILRFHPDEDLPIELIDEVVDLLKSAG